jgi:hypothetical protein
MLPDFLIGFVLVAANVSLHALGLAGLTSFLLSHPPKSNRLGALTWLLIRTAWFLIILHGIGVFALGARLLAAGLSARRRIGLLLFGHDLHNDRLR